MADKNGEDESCINGPGDEFEVRRKRNGNGGEKCCYGEEYAKILEHAVTKNLDFMSSLKEKHTKANKIARESKWKVAESCVWPFKSRSQTKTNHYIGPVHVVLDMAMVAVHNHQTSCFSWVDADGVIPSCQVWQFWVDSITRR